MKALALIQKYYPEVTKVIDGKKPIRIEVTKRDSNSAAVRDHKACALAVACKRKLNLDGVLIAVSVAYLVKSKKATRFQLPPSVSREVVSFDRKGGFDAGEYQLSQIRPAARLGRRTGGAKDKNTGNGHPKRFRHITQEIRTTLGTD